MTIYNPYLTPAQAAQAYLDPKQFVIDNKAIMDLDEYETFIRHQTSARLNEVIITTLLNTYHLNEFSDIGAYLFSPNITSSNMNYFKDPHNTKCKSHDAVFGPHSIELKTIIVREVIPTDKPIIHRYAFPGFDKTMFTTYSITGGNSSLKIKGGGVVTEDYMVVVFVDATRAFQTNFGILGSPIVGVNKIANKRINAISAGAKVTTTAGSSPYISITHKSITSEPVLDSDLFALL